jgi:hypothetical protein
MITQGVIWAALKDQANNNVWEFVGSGAPVNGSTGANIGGPGSTYTDVATGNIYVNLGTKASPAWSVTQGSLEVTVSSAELLALRATPKTLVPAPGAGKLIEFVSATLLADNGTAYVVGTNDLAIRYAGAAGDIISQTVDTAGFLDQVVDIMDLVLPIATDSKTPKADCENQPLVLHNTGAGELTTGTGVLRVKISYRIWTTGW